MIKVDGMRHDNPHGIDALYGSSPTALHTRHTRVIDFANDNNYHLCLSVARRRPVISFKGSPLSGPNASPARNASRAVWLKNLHQWHWISSALCLLGMFLFSITGITLNHA